MSDAVPHAAQTAAAIAHLMTTGEGDFGALALALFAIQLGENADYGRMCEGVDVRHWTDIPAVPVALWRDLPLVSFPLSEAVTVFRTSGTTGPRGVVHRRDTSLYDLGARAFAESVVGPIPQAGISLVPDAADSSLGHMCRSFAPHLVPCFTTARGLDVRAAWTHLRRLAAEGQPVFVPGTALALAAWVEAATTPVPLPHGSLVMVTGGFKGRILQTSAEQLRADLQALLPGAKLVEEYGMTELSSQMWAEGPGLPWRLPPWLRVIPVDPITGAPAETGILRFVDLANVDTVLAIETRDVGRLLPDGRLVLEGRLPGAPARGCSLSAEEAMGLVGATEAARVWPVAPAVEGMSEQSDDIERVGRLLRALASISVPADGWKQGLPLSEVRRQWDATVRRLTPLALLAELSTVPVAERGTSVAIVEAEGVFTASLEWVSIALSAGMSVRWKPPSSSFAFAEHVASVLYDAGFSIDAQPSRDLGTPEAVVVFGSDDGVLAVQQAYSACPVVGFGHRFSVQVLPETPTPERVSAVWDDLIGYGTRGCMAPVFALVVGGPAAPWARAIQALAKAASWLPALSPSDGPEWRRRVGLGQATGGAFIHQTGGAVVHPLSALVPSAVPGLLAIAEVPDLWAAAEFLSPWSARLSSIACPRSMETALSGLAPRFCRIGQLQHPTLPRFHDGRPMFATLCGRGE